MHTTTARFVTDAECKQGKCENNTTGCIGHCMLNESLALHTVTFINDDKYVANLQSELSATKEKLEAAEKRIRESQEQEPIGYAVYSVHLKYPHSLIPCGEDQDINDCSLGEFWAGNCELYATPPIPPELAELQRENAELRKQLHETCKAMHYPYCWDDAAYPTLVSAITEAFACSVCADPVAHGLAVDYSMPIAKT